MCARLVGAGYNVTAFDIRPDALAAAVAAGATAGDSATSIAAEVDLLLTSLPRPDHVEAVMGGTDGALSALRPGSIWVDLTTNRTTLVEALAATA